MPEWLVALAMTLFVVDIFVSTEVLSWCGVLSLAVWLTWRIHADLKWAVLLFIGSFVLFAFVYYLGVRATIGRLVRSWMQRGAPKELSDRLIGAVGTVHYVAGRPFFKWNGEELIPIMGDASVIFREGDVVSIDCFVGGKVLLRRQEHNCESIAT